jgi:D-hydroxyproline dehydrogenase subunit beta
LATFRRLFNLSFLLNIKIIIFNEMASPDLVIIGSGILGLAHALAAAKAGMSVEVIESTLAPQGASIRNFGMIWPIGQTPGELRDIALRSREIWLEVADQANLFNDPCGSLHLALHPIEAKLLNEFQSQNPNTTTILSPDETIERFPLVNPAELQSALFSTSELCVNPREALAQLPNFLNSEHGIRFSFGETVTNIDGNDIRTNLRNLSASKIFVCPGANFKILFPDFFTHHGVQQCQLQMLRLEPPTPDKRLQTMIAGGLTLSHYLSFRDCPSFPLVNQHHSDYYPEFMKRGIHVMASQHQSSEVTIGDSHTYGLDLPPFTEEQTDQLILGYLAKLIQSETWRVSSRWLGTYSKHPTKPLLKEQMSDATTICASPGGAGMTLSFGWAERNIADLTQ